MKRITAALLFSFTLFFIPFAYADEHSLEDETLGEISLNMNEADIVKILGPGEKSKGEVWGVDGATHFEIKYPDKGVTIGFVLIDKIGSPEIIMVESPSDFKTSKGIGIGSTYEETVKAYPKQTWATETENTKEHLVIGSIYGGLSFNFENGKVSQIHLGSFAE